MSVKDNLDRVRENIQNTLVKSGRELDDLTLITVTKTIDLDKIEEALSLGVKDIGENRVQELEKRIVHFDDRVNYHMIGHLQTNKVRNIVDKVQLIHSLDRMSLGKELNKRGKMNDIIVDALIQVNVAEEESKFGLKLEEVLPFIEKMLKFDNIRIKGLMTMAPYTEDEKILRHVFRQMYKLKEDIEKRNYKTLDMNYLSMGMSNDYEIAIEEGSNMVRVGSAIFGERKY